jgi:protein-disulfide isomerase
MYRTFQTVSVLAAVCFLSAPAAPQQKSAPKKAAAAKTVEISTAGHKSALDKPTLEAYVRHLFIYSPQIQVQVDDPKPSALPGFFEVTVRASAGQAHQESLFYVSKDGQKIIQGAMYDVNQNPFKADLDKLKTDLQPSFGTPGAPVVLVEFSDFQCTYCKQEAKVLRDNLQSAYPKQVRLYYADYPLEQLHPWARAGAIAGRCIFRQNAGAFWQFHDWIFEHQGEITPENLTSKVLEFAQGKEIDALQLSRCMETKATEAEVNKEIALGKSLNIDSTPTLFINGRRRMGSQDWPTLRAIIDYEIEYQKTAKNAGEDCGCELKLPVP